jgi:hypothetical protein
VTIADKSPSQKLDATANSTASIAIAFPNNVAVGSLLTVIVANVTTGADSPVIAGQLAKSAGTATVGTITMDKAEGTLLSGVYPMNVGIFSCIVTGAGSLTLTYTASSSQLGLYIAINEFTGSWDGSRVEATSSADGASTAPSAGTLTSAGAALFVDGFALGNGSPVTVTEDGTFTLIASDGGGAANVAAGAEFYVSGSGASGTPTWTTTGSGAWSAVGVVYKEAAAAAQSLSPYRRPLARRGAYRFH